MPKIVKDMVRTDNWIFSAACLINIFIETSYYTFILQPEHELNGRSLFLFFFFFVSGPMILLSAYLFVITIRGKNVLKKQNLLLFLALLQGITLVLDIIHADLHRTFMRDGYIFFALELLFILIYFRRYFFLRNIKGIVNAGMKRGVNRLGQ